jgi:hypothetical protein
MEKITGFFGGPKIDVTATSGRISVTVHPRPHWLAGFVTLGGDLIFAVVLYRFWSIAPVSIRAIWIIILGSTLFSSVYQFLGEEIIEIDSQKLTIRKGIHGWERTREYQINECSNFEWNPGRKGGSYLTCNVGRWPIKFGNRLSENDAGEIMSALQEALPDVAQKICTYPGSKEHFITLGLSRP